MIAEAIVVRDPRVHQTHPVSQATHEISKGKSDFKSTHQGRMRAVSNQTQKVAQEDQQMGVQDPQKENLEDSESDQ